MLAKTPLHVSPSSHAFRVYLYRCLAASHAPESASISWHEKPPAPEHKLGETEIPAPQA
jgi:hypothetical protein